MRLPRKDVIADILVGIFCLITLMGMLLEPADIGLQDPEDYQFDIKIEDSPRSI